MYVKDVGIVYWADGKRIDDSRALFQGPLRRCFDLSQTKKVLQVSTYNHIPSTLQGRLADLVLS